MNWILFLLGGLFVCEVSTNVDRVEIFVPKGPIVGKKYLVLGQSVIRFLGIPYAKPPVGKLRFRRPIPIEKWNQSVQALEWPNNCFQTPLKQYKHRFFNQNFSEDCLYLNIWSPDVNVNEQNLRPVVVWIHGNGFFRGGSSDRLYDLERFSVMADAVMVSINYRLSGLGFFYSDQIAEIKGNQGLWDQALALQWINENIRYFGGDSNAITLMGNSAGSWSVSIHILSPVSRNLFQNAIMMSGAANYNVVQEGKMLVPKMLDTIRSIGCATKDDLNITQQIIECLEQAEPDAVDKLSGIVQMVVVDGEFIPEDPSKMIINGNHKKKFNLLVSTVEDEGSFLFARNHPSFSNTATSISLNEAKNILIEALKNITNNQRSFDRETILKVYFSGLNEYYDDSDLFKKQVGVAYGDLILSCPTLKFAKDLYKSDPSTINVYQWFYRVKIGRIKDLCNKWGGTCHSDELYPAFGIPFSEKHLYHNREREISREITDFIKSFIRNGKPGKNQLEWLSYFLANDGHGNNVVVAPYYEISNQHRTFESFKFNLKQVECDMIWKEFHQ